MSKNRTQGFTLIELLVVIAIIGILATVVLASLNSAREKGGDAAVKSNLNTIRTQAEVYYSEAGRYAAGAGASFYSGNCLTTNTMFRMTGGDATLMALSKPIEDAIAAATAAGNGAPHCRMDAARDNYLVTVRLKSSNNYWCIDSSGSSKDIGSSLPSTGVLICP